jgi:hypothetical protein
LVEGKEFDKIVVVETRIRAEGKLTTSIKSCHQAAFDLNAPRDGDIVKVSLKHLGDMRVIATAFNRKRALAGGGDEFGGFEGNRMQAVGVEGKAI